MNKTTKGITAAILLVTLVIGSYCLIRVYLPYRAHQQELAEKEFKKVVDANRNLSYPGKSLGAVSLSHYTKEEIVELLKKEITPYQNSVARIELNGKEYTYSMQDLGQHIYYKCSNKRTFKAGDEERLASYLVLMDKRRTLEEQYNIIEKNIDPTTIDISIQCECDEESLTKFIKKLSDKYDKPPQNSRIDRNFKVLPAKAGQVLDTTEIANELRTYLNRQTTKNFSGSYRTSNVEPEWTAEDLKQVNTLVARYTTQFKKNTSRGYNIQLAAKRLHGRCLLPGEKISFLDVLYDDEDGKSYKKSGAYFKGKVVQAEGGGICQVSTTAYHTFLLAGIIPEKRYPHSMPVSYAKLGLDAALSVGGKDLVIENTLGVPLLLLAEAKDGTLAGAIQSYANALDGMTYKPRTKKISDLEAESFLDVYKGTEKIQTISLSHDTYEKRAG